MQQFKFPAVNVCIVSGLLLGACGSASKPTSKDPESFIQTPSTYTQVSYVPVESELLTQLGVTHLGLPQPASEGQETWLLRDDHRLATIITSGGTTKTWADDGSNAIIALDLDGEGLVVQASDVTRTLSAAITESAVTVNGVTYPRTKGSIPSDVTPLLELLSYKALLFTFAHAGASAHESTLPDG